MPRPNGSRGHARGDGNADPRLSGVTASVPAGLQSATSIAFSAQATDDDPLTYRWEFGDGTSSTEQNPTHVYTTPGSYVAKVTVSDGNGATTDRIQVAIKSLTNTCNPTWFRRSCSTRTASSCGRSRIGWS